MLDAPDGNIRPFGDGFADTDVGAEFDGEVGVVVAQFFHFAEEMEGVLDGLQRLEVDDIGDVHGEVHRDDGAAVGGHDDVLLVDAYTRGYFLVLVENHIVEAGDGGHALVGVLGLKGDADGGGIVLVGDGLGAFGQRAGAQFRLVGAGGAEVDARPRKAGDAMEGVVAVDHLHRPRKRTSGKDRQQTDYQNDKKVLLAHFTSFKNGRKNTIKFAKFNQLEIYKKSGTVTAPLSLTT